MDTVKKKRISGQVIAAYAFHIFFCLYALVNPDPYDSVYFGAYIIVGIAYLLAWIVMNIGEAERWIYLHFLAGAGIELLLMSTGIIPKDGGFLAGIGQAFFSVLIFIVAVVFGIVHLVICLLNRKWKKEEEAGKVHTPPKAVVNEAVQPVKNYISGLREYVGHKPLMNVGATVIVLNEKNELLLNLRTDTGTWGIIGGGTELGESLEQTAARELMEEAGLTAEKYELLDVYSGKELYFRYPNGDETYSVIVLYKAVGVSGELRINDGESSRLQYFPLDELPELESRAAFVIDRIKDKLPDN